jgi:hypothetical protein
MDGTDDFFSRNHLRLLNIASWAKSLAWIALVLYVLWTGLQITQLLLAKDDGNFIGQTSQSFLTMLTERPWDLFEQMVRTALTLLRGIIYFVILKGISLGLNMIVETDINYREKEGLQHE